MRTARLVFMVMAIARRAHQDWNDPKEDRRTTAILILIFGLVLAGVAFVLLEVR